MIVCICHRVSDRDIAAAAQQGCCDFEELQDELRVATSCGACRDCARDTFHRHAHGHGSACAQLPSRPESLALVAPGATSISARRIAAVAHRGAAPAAGA